MEVIATEGPIRKDGYMMKVFVPISDALLGTKGRVTETLVPFNPEFLPEAGRAKEGCKPANWIPEADYASACRRLREGEREQV